MCPSRYLSCILILFQPLYVPQSFAVMFMLSTKCYFSCSCFHLFRSHALHPQFASSYSFPLNIAEHVKTFTAFGDYNKRAHFLVCMLISPLARHNSMLDILSQKKKGSHGNTNVSFQTSSISSHLVLASVFSSKFCCDVHAFHKMLFFLLVLSSVSGVAHFIHSLPVLIFCPECLVIVANKA